MPGTPGLLGRGQVPVHHDSTGMVQSTTSIVIMDVHWITTLVLIAVVGVRGNDPLCSDNLLASIPDDHLSASSSRSDPTATTSPNRGRLNTTESSLNNGTILMGGWSPSSDSSSEYLQANFDGLVMINNIVTQGRNQVGGYVTSYKLQYTQDGVNWETVNNDIGVEQIFMGNSDSDTLQDGDLACPVFAKGIRIIPLSWDQNIGLRFEVNGCYVDNTPNTATGTSAPGPNLSTTPPFLPGIVTPMGPIATQQTTPNLPLSSNQPHVVTTTAAPITTTTPYVFLPGIPNPFGTTSTP